MLLCEIGSWGGSPNIIRNLGSSGSGEWSTARKLKPTKEQLQAKKEEAAQRKATANMHMLRDPANRQLLAQFELIAEEVEEVLANVPQLAGKLSHFLRFSLRDNVPGHSRNAIHGMSVRLETSVARMHAAIAMYDISELIHQTEMFEIARVQLLDVLNTVRPLYPQSSDDWSTSRLISQLDEWITVVRSMQLDIDA